MKILFQLQVWPGQSRELVSSFSRDVLRKWMGSSTWYGSARQSKECHQNFHNIHQLENVRTMPFHSITPRHHAYLGDLGKSRHRPTTLMTKMLNLLTRNKSHLFKKRMIGMFASSFQLTILFQNSTESARQFSFGSWKHMG